MRASELPFESYKSKRILFLSFQTRSVKNKFLRFSIFSCSEKLHLIVQKSLSSKKIFRDKNVFAVSVLNNLLMHQLLADIVNIIPITFYFYGNSPFHGYLCSFALQ